jgi:hypothetical protein
MPTCDLIDRRETRGPMGSMSRDTMHQGLMAGVARPSAPAPAAPVAAEPFAFAAFNGFIGAPMSITADQAWLQTWDLRSAYSVKHTHRPTRRPLERSP